MNTNPTQFTLEVGLTLKTGVNLIELVRVLDGDEYLFEDTKTRRPTVLTKDKLLEGVYSKKYIVVLADEKGLARQVNGPMAVVLDLASLTDRERVKLDERYEYVKALDRQGVSRGRRSEVTEVIKKVAARIKAVKIPSASTVMKWARDYAKSGNNYVALVDQYRVAKRKLRIHPVIESLIWDVLKRCYFTLDRFTAKHAYDQLQIAFKKKVKTGELAVNDQVPGYSSFVNRIHSVDLYHRIATREGHGRARMQCRTAFPDGYPEYPLERVEIDHTPLNWVVICDRTGLPLGRAVLTVMIDSYSGYVLGFYISFYGPGLTSVSGVARNALKPKSTLLAGLDIKNPWLSHGLGDEWVVDNGLEFHSFGFRQMAMSLGVDIMYCRVRTPWLKPRVERFFAGLDHLTLAKGRISKKVANVVNIDPYKDAAIVFSDLVQGLLKFFVDIHPFEPNWRKMARPFDLFQEGLERCPPAIYPGNLDQLTLATGMSKMLTTSQGGIQLNGLPYGSYEFKDFAKRHGSKCKVLCKWDPDDIHRLHVQNPEDKSWMTAYCRWKHYSQGLSHNQHKLIRDFSRKELKASGQLDDLMHAKDELHQHFLDATSNRKRADALKAARYADLTSSKLTYVEQQDPEEKPQSEPLILSSEPKLYLPQALDVQVKDIPVFESFLM
jgi:putative transposase